MFTLGKYREISRLLSVSLLPLPLLLLPFPTPLLRSCVQSSLPTSSSVQSSLPASSSSGKAGQGTQETKHALVLACSPPRPRDVARESSLEDSLYELRRQFAQEQNTVCAQPLVRGHCKCQHRRRRKLVAPSHPHVLPLLLRPQTAYACWHCSVLHVSMPCFCVGVSVRRWVWVWMWVWVWVWVWAWVWVWVWEWEWEWQWEWEWE